MIRDHVLYDLIAPQELLMVLNYGFLMFTQHRHRVQHGQNKNNLKAPL